MILHTLHSIFVIITFAMLLFLLCFALLHYQVQTSSGPDIRRTTHSSFASSDLLSSIFVSFANSLSYHRDPEVWVAVYDITVAFCILSLLAHYCQTRGLVLTTRNYVAAYNNV